MCHLNPSQAPGGAGFTGSGIDPISPAHPGSALLDEEMRELTEIGAGAIVFGEEEEYVVAFTFDDGPKESTTPRVLKALADYDVPATFFVVGWRFAKERKSSLRRAAILRDILADGHLIANHTFNHKNLASSPIAVGRREVDSNTAALIDHLGFRPHGFRPPYGAVKKSIRAHLRSQGLTEVRWGTDTLDFRHELRRTLRKRTMKGILKDKGGVVLMHDTKELTAKNIAGILDDLERENCRRLGNSERPILPVSIHYFLREPGGEKRPVPDHVRARTKRYRDRLPERCAARAKKK